MYSKQSITQQAGGITSAVKLIVVYLALTTSTSIYLMLVIIVYFVIISHYLLFKMKPVMLVNSGPPLFSVQYDTI